MQEIVTSLQEKTELNSDEAQAAVDHVLEFLKSKLPNSVYQYIDHTANGKSTTDIVMGLEGFIPGYFGH
jgi:hypothetical protein